MGLLVAMPFSQGWSSVSTGDSMVMMYRYVCVAMCMHACVCACMHACVHACVCVFVCVYEGSVLFCAIYILSHRLQLPWLLSLLPCSVGV